MKTSIDQLLRQHTVKEYHSVQNEFIMMYKYRIDSLNPCLETSFSSYQMMQTLNKIFNKILRLSSDKKITAEASEGLDG